MDELQQAWEFIRDGGLPAALFLWGISNWVERRQLQKKYDDLLERTLNALNGAANAVQAMKDLLTAGGRSR